MIIDYIKLSSREYRELRDSILAIAQREQGDKLVKFLGYEQLFVPAKITIETEKFIWDFSVIVAD